MEKNTAASADFCFVHFTDTHIMAGGVHPPTQVDTAALASSRSLACSTRWSRARPLP